MNRYVFEVWTGINKPPCPGDVRLVVIANDWAEAWDKLIIEIKHRKACNRIHQEPTLIRVMNKIETHAIEKGE